MVLEQALKRKCAEAWVCDYVLALNLNILLLMY